MRLVRTAGISDLPSRDWFALLEYPTSPHAIGSRWYQVRNPVDAYQSTFRINNPKYVETKDANDLEWKLTFDQYLATVWEAYVTHFDNVPVPRVIMRYEDLYRDPQ
eukprot:512609-Prorocentrum_minimum.AAC.1